MLLARSCSAYTVGCEFNDGITIPIPTVCGLGNIFAADPTARASAARVALFSGNDAVTGGSKDDYFNVLAGHDVVMGGAGFDSIYGGDGNDHLYGQSPNGGPDGSDYITGDDGNDYIQGNAGNDDLDGGRGSDRINGGAGDDYVFASEGNDTVNGNTGKDYIDGWTGNDVLRGGQGNDMLRGGSGYNVDGRSRRRHARRPDRHRHPDRRRRRRSLHHALLCHATRRPVRAERDHRLHPWRGPHQIQRGLGSDGAGHAEPAYERGRGGAVDLHDAQGYRGPRRA